MVRQKGPSDQPTRRGRYDRTQSKEERFAEQRVKLLDSATDVFAERGHVDTTVQDVIDRCGLSRATFYVHFKDVDDLRFHVYERAAGRAFAIVSQAVLESRPSERLKNGLDAFMRTTSQHGNMARVVAHEIRIPSPANIARREMVMQRFVSLFLEGLKDAASRGVITTVPDETIVYALIAGIEGVCLRYLDRREEAKAPEAVPALMEFVRRLVGAPSPDVK
jgi:AcrR family transcriptional regulator